MSRYEQMNHVDLPPSAKQRIIHYYSEMWKYYRTLNGKPLKIVGDMNNTLKDEVMLSLRNFIFKGYYTILHIHC